jgi:arylsulfatase
MNKTKNVMSKYTFLFSLCSFLFCAASCIQKNEKQAQQKPNFIYILTDDQGYNDLGCFGSPLIKTPRFDQMAAEGMRFTNFYAQTVCGPSRSSIMTGCYPLRVAKKGNSVEIHPRMDLNEITVAEMLKDVGYTTAAFGKWDLAGHSQEPRVNNNLSQGGYDPDLMPLHQGFDYFFGTPSSNDHYVNLIRNDSLIERKADMSLLTKRYTDEAIVFIEKNKKRPFFVYLAHSMPHTELAASIDFLGKSPRGLYGDVIMELDYNTGRILDKLKKLGLDKNTYVIFSSDNGPWWIKKLDGGSSDPLRGAKTSTWEGGLRVPCIMWGPGHIPAGTVCNEMAATLDIFPTFAKLAGGKIPSDRVIDGHDISPLWQGKKQNETRVFYYYEHTKLQAVLSGKWKLILPDSSSNPGLPNWGFMINPKDNIDIDHPTLFDLENDIGESKDVSTEYPEIVNQLLQLAEQGRNDIGDYDRIGKCARFFDSATKRPDIGKPFREYPPQSVNE